MSNKESIKLRKRKLPTGNTTLYLDIYRNGKRDYEYLKLYLIPEKSRADKEKNRETLKLAEAIKAKRTVELQNHEYGFKNDYADETKFFDYYRAMCQSRLGNESRGNWGNWRSCLKHLEKYESNPDITFADITPKWVQGFKDYLEKEATAWGCDFRERIKDHPLSRNSKLSYFNKLRACLNQAFEERIISRNPMLGIDNFKAEEGTRMYLTLEEVKLLVQTECEYPNIKRAFLFSCLTGLRRSDIIKLTWGEVQKFGQYTRLVFKQKKTGGQEYLDIPNVALEYLGERGNEKASDLVFRSFKYSSETSLELRRWALAAGISKDFTFHCSRHTFAVMLLNSGADIYTVSKLLGHRELQTTQIYAHILDKKKQDAISTISDLFDK